METHQYEKTHTLTNKGKQYIDVPGRESVLLPGLTEGKGRTGMAKAREVRDGKGRGGRDGNGREG